MKTFWILNLGALLAGIATAQQAAPQPAEPITVIRAGATR
jgi:hypothetical protein